MTWPSWPVCLKVPVVAGTRRGFDIECCSAQRGPGKSERYADLRPAVELFGGKGGFSQKPFNVGRRGNDLRCFHPRHA